MAFLAALMKEYGEEISGDIEDYKTISDRRESATRQELLEKEGLLRQLHTKHAMMFKKCKNCQQGYQTNYCYQEYCSDPCRDDAFYKKYGVRFKDLKVKPTSGFWEYEPVLNISTSTLEALYEYCQWVVTNYEELRERSREIPEEPIETFLEEEPDPEPLTVRFGDTVLTSPGIPISDFELEDYSPQSPLPTQPTTDDPLQFDPAEFDVDPFL